MSEKNEVLVQDYGISIFLTFKNVNVLVLPRYYVSKISTP